MKDPELIPAVYGSGGYGRGSSTAASTAPSAVFRDHYPDSQQEFPKKRRAWVVADWKSRLPGATLPQESTAARRLRLKEAAQERKQQLAFEYADMYATIDGILERCDGITKTYGSKQQQKQRQDQSKQPQGSQPHLTMRSRAAYTAARPSTAPAMDASRCTAASMDSTSAAKAAIQQAQCWVAPVDLNPGMQFRPGTPQRTAATAPELPALVARMAALSDDLRRLDMTQLTHREHLQAAIQQLNSEFYAALKECGMMPDQHSTSTLSARGHCSH